MTRLLHALLPLPALAGVALLVGACSSTSVGTKAAEPPVGSTASSFVQAYCELFAPCCDGAGLPQDQARCEQSFASAGAARNYDAARGTACLDELRASKRFCDYAIDAPDAPSCRGVFTQQGAQRLGQACEAAQDCAPSAEGWVECVSTYRDGATSRTCQLRLAGKEGDAPCVATVDENGPTLSSYGSTDAGGPPPPRGYTCNHDEGLRCDDTTAACVRVSAIGGPCSGLFADDECPKNAYCTYAADAGAAIDARACAARLAPGAACDSSTTIVDACDRSERCDAESKRCVPRAVAGAPCTTSAACATGLCVNGLCKKVVELQLGGVCGGAK